MTATSRYSISRFLSHEVHVVNPLVDESEEHRVQARKLASIYRHVRNSNPLDQWSTSIAAPNDPLAEILITHSKNGNHAVLGALLQTSLAGRSVKNQEEPPRRCRT